MKEINSSLKRRYNDITKTIWLTEEENQVLLDYTSEIFKVEKDRIKSTPLKGNRITKLVEARSFIYYYLYNYRKYTDVSIAKYLNYEDHTSVGNLKTKLNNRFDSIKGYKVSFEFNIHIISDKLQKLNKDKNEN